MTLKVRGSNPVWANFDLEGLIFDDTYYLYVLENEFPYLPSSDVFINDTGSSAANFPIQYLANGTLPVDIFFTTGVIYRLEFRKNDGTASPSQSDALIYLVENYSPQGAGSDPIPTGTTINTDNQAANPQFSLVSFTSPSAFSLTDESINIAPGWDIVVAGTGTLTVSQLSLSSSDDVPTNAPYALSVQTLGFSSAYLRQRYEQNGTIWSEGGVATSVTARTIDSLPYIIGTSLVNNASSPMDLAIGDFTLTSAWQEFRSAIAVPESTNETTSNSSWTDFRISLPASGTIGLTSLQITGQDTPVEVPFEQETLARQQDHLFHVYRNSLLQQPKSNLLTGANWSLNPWQFRATASATSTVQTEYTADQTIIHQQTGTSKIAVGQGVVGDNYPLNVTAVTSDNRFAVIEYIDPSTIRPYWNDTLSALLKAKITTTHSSIVRFKFRLIYRESLPPTLSAIEPVASWTGAGDPIFDAAWTEIKPKNDPVYTLTSSYDSFAFESMALPVSTNADMTLGIVIYTIDEMDESSTADSIQFERCSLVPNEYAIDANVLTFDENLRRCEFYYEKSYDVGILPGALTATNEVNVMGSQVKVGSTYTYTYHSVGFRYKTTKRAAPNLATYDPTQDAVADATFTYIMSGTSIGLGTTQSFSGNYSLIQKGKNALFYGSAIANTNSSGLTDYTPFTKFHYTLDARLAI